jgi:hypothetical protein
MRPLGRPRCRWEDTIRLDLKEIGVKRPLGRPRCRWEDTIRLDLKEIGVNTRNWVDSAQDRDYWRTLRMRH